MMTPKELESMTIEDRFKLFTEWVGNQPMDKQYVYFDINNCPLAQFGKYILETDNIFGGGIDIGDANFELEIIPVRHLINVEPKTFGALYERILKL